MKILRVLWLTLTAHIGWAGEADSLLHYNDLIFKTDFEQEYFQQLITDQSFAFPTLMTVGDKMDRKTIETDWNKFKYEIEKLQKISVPSKKKGKYFKEVYSRVHDRFFKKYELKNRFCDVFTAGKYNCVSASAIYAMVFSELNIEYVIKETPTHVYLILEPGANQYIIETTDPTGGINKLSSGFKANFLKTLAESKLIDQVEYVTTDQSELFNKYYFTQSNLNLKQLVGVQYSNEALFLAEEDDFEGSLRAIQKAQFLNPSEKNNELLLYFMTQYISRADYRDEKNLSMIGLLSRFEEKQIPDDVLVGEFGRINKEVFIDNGNISLYEKYFETTMNMLERETVLREIEFVYNYERGRILYNRASYAQAFDFILPAYRLKPKNADVEAMFTGLLGEVLQSVEDPNDILDQLSKLLIDFPDLKENNRFGGIYLNAYLMAMASSIDRNQIETGKDYRDRFEKLATDNPNYEINQSLVGYAYSQLAVYYFKKGYYKSARGSISRGLKFAPDNSELTARMRMMRH